MAEQITAAQFHKALVGLCDTIEEQKEYLSDLDGAIGDGDHGVNMAKCFRGVKKNLEALEVTDVASVMNCVGMEVMNSVGGAMGALYGTLFLKMAIAGVAKKEVTLVDFAAMMTEALNGILTIGKAKVGDKTLVDTLTPAVEALVAASEDGKALGDGLGDFEAAAKSGMESTKDLMARIGRASRLGERTIGHQDAGATSCFFILQSLAHANS
ncbi:MAG: dihydroxyacetone kinase-like protein [Desulforhopalus sp.]|jgi:dihydroxyacetone kinase-like protein